MALVVDPGIKVDRLLKCTFAKDMAIKPKWVAQYHISSELPTSCANMAIHSAGENKYGCSYTTFDFKNEQGKLIVCDFLGF